MRRGSLSARVALAETSIPEGPRRELRRGVTGVDLELGGVAIRAGDLPLLRRAEDGLRQCVRLAVTAPERRGRATFSLFAGIGQLDTATAELEAETTTVHLFAPAVDAPTRVRLRSELEGGPARSDELTLLPQRRWHVHLIHHSHFDLGYTDPQARVLRHHLHYLDSTLDLAATHEDFRWTVESNLPLERWLAVRPEAAREEFLGHLLSGRFEVCALPFTMHVEALSIDELTRQLRFAHDLRRRHGVEVVTAMQTDVPGAPPGLPLVLADAGIRYLAVAHNWAARATPHLTGGETLPRAFNWATEGGQAGARLAHRQPTRHRVPGREPPRARRFVCDRSRSAAGVPRGARAPRLPVPRTARDARASGRRNRHVRAVPVRAAPLARSGAARRQRRSEPGPGQDRRGLGQANSPTRSSRPSTNREFFERLEERHGGELETFGGDWTDWWADGLGSAAREVGSNRRAQAAVRTAQTLQVMATRLDGRRSEPGPSR